MPKPTEKEIALARKLLLFMENQDKPISLPLLKSLFEAHLRTHKGKPTFMVEIGWLKHQLALFESSSLDKVPPGSRRILVRNLVRRRTEGVWDIPDMPVTNRKRV